jgi:hypothetical protein
MLSMLSKLRLDLIRKGLPGVNYGRHAKGGI